MRFINILSCLLFVFCSYGCDHRCDVSEILPEYRLIKRFSKKINKETGLVLYSYGINNFLEKNYQFKKGTANFTVTYNLSKGREDSISLEEARCLLVSVSESFLKEINADLEIRDELDVYPMTSDFINVTIVFVDENRIQLGQGIAYVYFAHGQVSYDTYQIAKYTGDYHTYGKHFQVHEESYAEALEIAKKQNCLKQL